MAHSFIVGCLLYYIPSLAENNARKYQQIASNQGILTACRLMRQAVSVSPRIHQGKQAVKIARFA
jgi:hypothetical protein